MASLSLQEPIPAPVDRTRMTIGTRPEQVSRRRVLRVTLARHPQIEISVPCPSVALHCGRE
jgi:hypothetical protein